MAADNNLKILKSIFTSSLENKEISFLTSLNINYPKEKSVLCLACACIQKISDITAKLEIATQYKNTYPCKTTERLFICVNASYGHIQTAICLITQPQFVIDFSILKDIAQYGSSHFTIDQAKQLYLLWAGCKGSTCLSTKETFFACLCKVDLYFLQHACTHVWCKNSTDIYSNKLQGPWKNELYSMFESQFEIPTKDQMKLIQNPKINKEAILDDLCRKLEGVSHASKSTLIDLMKTTIFPKNGVFVDGSNLYNKYNPRPYFDEACVRKVEQYLSCHGMCPIFVGHSYRTKHVKVKSRFYFEIPAYAHKCNDDIVWQYLSAYHEMPFYTGDGGRDHKNGSTGLYSLWFNLSCLNNRKIPSNPLLWPMPQIHNGLLFIPHKCIPYEWNVIDIS